MDILICDEIIAEDGESINENSVLINDNDNQKLFDIYEKYLINGDISESDSDSDISFDDSLTQIIKSRETKHNRVSRRFNTYAQIEVIYHQETAVTRESLRNDKSMRQLVNDDEDYDGDDVILPYDLTNANETQVIEIINELENDIEEMENKFPPIIVESMKRNFDSCIKAIDNYKKNLKIQMENRVLAIELKSIIMKVNYKEMIEKLLHEIQTNFDTLNKLISDVEICQRVLSQ